MLLWFSHLNTEGRVHQWACIAEKIVLSHPGRCDSGQLLCSFYCRKPSVWKRYRRILSTGRGRNKIWRGTEKRFPIIESFFLTKIILGGVCVYLITVVWFHSQLMFMRVIIIIIKQESGSWSGQDQNIYLTTEVGIFWKGKIFCLVVMTLKVKAWEVRVRG